MANLIHLNGNLLCVIDLETTGLDPDVAEIVQICILPLDSQYKPNKDIRPFYTNITPENKQNINKDRYDSNFSEKVRIPKDKLTSMINTGLDRGVAADNLYEWFQKLGLPEKKRIAPLAQNWVFDRSFLIKWLGWTMFEEIFDPRYRDTLAAASFINDYCDFHGQQCPYQKQNLKFLCSVLKVENASAHDALSDCQATAECYRRMISNFIPSL